MACNSDNDAHFQMSELIFVILTPTIYSEILIYHCASPFRVAFIIFLYLKRIFNPSVKTLVLIGGRVTTPRILL